MKTVKDLMTRDVQTIVSTAAIAEAAKLMRDGDFGLLSVGTPERLEGTISDRDIVIRAIAEGKGADTPVAGVMSAGVSAVREDDTLAEASAQMQKHRVRRLPVLNANGQLVGILSLGDLAVEPMDLQPAAKALKDISTPS